MSQNMQATLRILGYKNLNKPEGQINCMTGLPSCHYCSYCGCTGGVLGHAKFMFWLKRRNTKKHIHKFIKSFSALDYSKIEDVEVADIDTGDYPDFCDAHIVAFTYKGREATETEIERLNEDSDYVYECVQKEFF